MTFRVADLMLEPVLAAGKKRKKPAPCRGHTRCGKCTLHTPCTACSLHSDCTLCTGCTVCTCTRCTLTAASTCTGETDRDQCSCPGSEERNLVLLQAALRSKLEARASAA